MAGSDRIVVATARADLAAAVARLAAIVGAGVEAVATSAAVRSGWRAARVVVVGDDLAAAVAAAGLSRRPDVLVVTDHVPDDGLWRSAVAVGAAGVLQLPVDEPALVELLGAALDAEPADGQVVAVMGGCGGAGASTFAAALAITASASRQTVLVDGDAVGGGLDLLLGAEGAPGARWSELATTKGRLGTTALRSALVDIHGLHLLSCGRDQSAQVEAPAAAAVIDAAVRTFGLIVVDLPRRLDAAGLVLATAAQVVIVVVPATVRATASAAATIAALAREPGDLLLVVRDARAGELSGSEVARALGLPVGARLRSEQSVAKAAGEGRTPLRRRRGSLYEACQQVLSDVARVAPTPT